ncbi:MAG: hypothetical protein QM742_12425 [Aquabacterium sp.]
MQGDLVLTDARQQCVRQGEQLTPSPQPRGLEQGVRQPQVGIAGGVGVEQAPLAVVMPAPSPAGQPAAQLALREVAVRPAQQGVEAVAVVGHQGEKEAVGLALRGGVAAVVLLVDDAAVGLDEGGGIG